MKHLILLLVVLLSIGHATINPAEFRNGDILYPDYTHDDTLIVTDAYQLNFVFRTNPPQTDEDIADLLSKTTVICSKPL